MTVYFKCAHCKRDLHYDAKRGESQINLICPNCGKSTLLQIDDNESILDSYGFQRAAILGGRLLIKMLFGY